MSRRRSTCSAATASTPCSTCTRTSTTRTSAARERPTGPCAPTTCRSCPSSGRWSNNYANPQLQMAMQHFWSNDVVGDLQGNFDLVWATVADYFKNNRWVVGYDPFNEPFSTETQVASESTFTGQLECFYTGKGHTGFLANGADPARVPVRCAGQRRHPGDPGRRSQPPDLRGAGHLLGHRREHSVPAGPDALPAAGLQFPRLLRRPQPAHRQPDQPVAVPPVRADRGIRAGRHPPVDELRVPVERTRHLHERIRRDHEHGAGRIRHRGSGIGPGGLGLLGLEVLRRPHGILRRRSRPARRQLHADRDGPVADVPPGGGGHSQLHPVQPLHGRLQHGVRADPRRTRCDDGSSSRRRSTTPTAGVRPSRAAASPHRRGQPA